MTVFSMDMALTVYMFAHDDDCFTATQSRSTPASSLPPPPSLVALLPSFVRFFPKRVSVKRNYGVCDWGWTHIAVERKHKEWRDHGPTKCDTLSLAPLC